MVRQCIEMKPFILAGQPKRLFVLTFLNKVLILRSPNVRFHACFEQVVPGHLSNYRFGFILKRVRDLI